MTKPVLYRHFDSKKALYLTLLDKHAPQLPRFVDPAVGAEPPVARPPAFLDGWFAYVQEWPYAWKMIFRDTSGDHEIQAARQEERARIVLAELLRSQPDVAIREQELEPTAELLRTAMAGLAVWWIDHPTVPRPLRRPRYAHDPRGTGTAHGPNASAGKIAPPPHSLRRSRRTRPAP